MNRQGFSRKKCAAVAVATASIFSAEKHSKFMQLGFAVGFNSKEVYLSKALDPPLLTLKLPAQVALFEPVDRPK